MNPPPDFNRLASLYRWMELLSFGPLLWWCRCAFLDDLAACRQALVLGDGDGRFTARLLGKNPSIHIDAVDASPAMLRALVRRASRAVPGPSRLRTYCADVRVWYSPTPADLSCESLPPYDLIVTHFFLDCLTTEEIQCLAARLRNAVSPSALWLVSEFAVPAGRFGQLVARPLVAGLYWAFARLTGLAVSNLPRHASALRESGFALQERRTWLGGLLISELYSASLRIQR